MLEVLITFIVVLSIIVSLCCGCTAICCCCFAIPVFRLLTKKFNLNQYSLSRTEDTGSQYQTVSPSAPPLEETDPEEYAIAEAYFVHPLVGVHTDQTEQLLVSITPEQQQSLQSQTQLGLGGGSNSCNDLWAALLFFCNVAVIVWLAVWTAVTSFSASPTNEGDEGAGNPSSVGLLELILGLVLLTAGSAAVVGSFWLSFMLEHAKELIEYVLWGNIVFSCIMAALMLLSGFQIVGALMFSVSAVFSYCYLQAVRPRIPFASAVLSTACVAIKEHYLGLVGASSFVLLTQVLWASLWATATFGVCTSLSQGRLGQQGTQGVEWTDDGGGGQGGLSGGILFLLLLSLFWGLQLMSAVMQTTVAGTVATWWFHPKPSAEPYGDPLNPNGNLRSSVGDGKGKQVVSGAFFRAVTSSLGSLCFGSLFVAVVQALRELVHSVREQGRRRDRRERNWVLDCLLWVLDFLLKQLERIMLYLNRYAYCYVAAYGFDFLTSGKQVMALFQRRGWSGIINDNLINRVLTFGTLTLGFINAIIGVIIALIISFFLSSLPTLSDTSNLLYSLLALGAGLGFLVGSAVGSVLTSVLDSAVATVFVCFAEDPMVFQRLHYEEYLALSTHWNRMYPNSIQTGNTPLQEPSHAFSATSHFPGAKTQPQNPGFELTAHQNPQHYFNNTDNVRNNLNSANYESPAFGTRPPVAVAVPAERNINGGGRVVKNV